MEQKKQIMSSGLVYDRLPPNLSPKYPWLISQTLEANNNEDQIFYTIHANYPTTHNNNYYRCRIPELVGRRIRGCFHGWVILSSHPDQVMWSLWNPLTSKTISLPPLILKDQSDPAVSIKQCCLSSPPPPHDHQDSSCSVLLLTRTNKSTFVFCRLDDSTSCKKSRKKRWIEMTYTKQLKSITGSDNDLLHCLTFCNGKLYALSSAGGITPLVQVDIKDISTSSRGGGEVVITLLLLGNLPYPFYNNCEFMTSFLKGSGTQLFYIKLGFDKIASKTIGAVYLFKLDFTSMTWEEIMEDYDDDVNDNVVFFVNLAHHCSVDCRRAINASESGGGGYIHILGDTGRVIYSCHVKDKIVSVSRLPAACLVVPTIHVSLWECRLQAGDHDEEEIKCRANNNSKQEDDRKMVVRSGVGDDDEESILVNYIPFDVLETIMKFCIGVDYLKFRATCKYCRLAAPMIGWRNTTHEVRRRFHTVSPWLVVFDKYKGIITFTDPMFGDNYFIKTPPELIGEHQILCSGYGWLLLLNRVDTLELFFYNPFTNDVRRLPQLAGVDSICFSEPPTSLDCMLVGFSAIMHWNVHIHFVHREQSWLLVAIHFGSTVPPNFFKFPTFYGGDRDIYVLNGGQLNVFGERLAELGSYYSWDGVVAEAPPIRGGGGCSSSSSQSQSSSAMLYFLVKCDPQHLLLVAVDEFGESIEVFKQRRQNDDHQAIISGEYWEKINSLGRHMIYICGGSTCLCVEAKTPEMENKIFFPLHNKSGKIVFYSLDTCMFHTFDGRKIDEAGIRDFFGTKYHMNTHAWIEPSWS